LLPLNNPKYQRCITIAFQTSLLQGALSFFHISG